MAQIQGKYFIYAFVGNSSYTLTGADRQGSFSVSSPAEELNLNCITGPNGNNAIVFNVENKINIRRARVRMNGGPGIQAGLNHIAAKFKIIVGRVDGDNNVFDYDSVWVQVPNFGEWAAIDLLIEPYKRTGNDRSYDFVTFIIDPNNAIFYVDDYNLQADYVGQGITPIVEFEIETAGVYLKTNGQIF